MSGAKFYDPKDVPTHQGKKPTPEEVVRGLNDTILPTLAAAADSFNKAVESIKDPKHEDVKRIFVALADAYTAMTFAIGCYLGTKCDVCTPEYSDAGLKMAARADAMIHLARMYEKAKDKNDPPAPDEIPDPPEGSPIN